VTCGGPDVWDDEFDDRRIKWLALTACGETVPGKAYRPDLVPRPGDPVKCGHKSEWSPVVDVVTAEPERDSEGSTR
jgi:hypothetical protein